MATDTELTEKQVKTWFANARNRPKNADNARKRKREEDTLAFNVHVVRSQPAPTSGPASGKKTGPTSAPAPAHASNVDEDGGEGDVDGGGSEGGDSVFGEITSLYLQSFQPLAPLSPKSEKQKLKDELATAVQEHDVTKDKLTAANRLATTLTVPPKPNPQPPARDPILLTW